MAPRMPKGGALPGLCAAAIAILTLMVPILQAPATTDSPAAASKWRPEDHARVSQAAHRGHGPQACNHCHGPNMPGASLPKPMRLSLEDLRAMADRTAAR